MTEPQHISKSLVNDLILPTILFVSAGFFGWAIRGTYGYGAIPGSTFAATCWAITWYFLSRSQAGQESNTGRPYSSGWAVLAIILGIGIEGMHPWMQYSSWRRGLFPVTNSSTFVPLDPAIGYIWWFVAAVPWAGTGAILLGWTASRHRCTITDWLLRIALGTAGLFIGLAIWAFAPQIILPDYQTGLYANLSACYGCTKAIGDTGIAMAFMGLFLGFLTFEILKKEWRNVKLILIVGIVTGIWWMAFQALNIQVFAWRYWETTSGAGIGLAYGLGYYFCNKPEPITNLPATRFPNVERAIGVNLAVILAVGFGLYHAIWAALGNVTGIQVTINLPALILVLGGAIGIWLISAIFSIRNSTKESNRHDITSSFTWLYFIAYGILHLSGFLVTITESNWAPLTTVFTIFYAVLAGVDMTIAVVLIKNKIVAIPSKLA